MINDSTQQEHATVINRYTPHRGALKYLKQEWTELKGEIDTSPSVMDGKPERRPIRKQGYTPVRAHRRVQVALPENNIMYVLESTWNILQDRSNF